MNGIVRIFSRPILAVAVCAVLGAVLGRAAAGVAPRGVRVSMAFTIAEQARQETADFSYDGYYSLQASNLVAETLISWLSTPAFIKDLYDRAGLAMTDTGAAAAAGRLFRARKFSSQNVVMTFNAPDRVTAERLSAQAAALLPAKVAGLVLSPKAQPLFVATPSAPVISDAVIPPAAASVAGALIGTFAGFAGAYYAHGRKRRPA